MNLFANIPEGLPEELTTTLLTAESVRIERIVSFGQSSPEGFWYEQSEDEWVLLLEGSAQLRFEDRIQNLVSGDCINIPAGCRHRVEKTDLNCQTIWVAVFYKNEDKQA
jgi:cupin 2 domain-containing protein